MVITNVGNLGQKNVMDLFKGMGKWGDGEILIENVEKGWLSIVIG